MTGCTSPDPFQGDCSDSGMTDGKGVDDGKLRAIVAPVEQRSRLKCIDVHSHFIPASYREAAIAAGHSKPDGMPAFPAWDKELALETMERLGIEKSFLSVSSPGIHFGVDIAAQRLARMVNEEGAALKAKYPDRFGHFASLPLPSVAGALSEIDHAFDTLGSDGVILESNCAGLYPGDPEFDPVFAELNRREAVVLLHPTSPYCTACQTARFGMPAPVLEFMFETARAVTSLLLSGTISRFPDISFIIPHAGATLPVLVDRLALVSEILADPPIISRQNLFAELGKLYFDMAGTPAPRLLPALRSFADPARLLYGSDWPFTPEVIVSRLHEQLSSHLAEEPTLLANIRRNNALSLFSVRHPTGQPA